MAQRRRLPEETVHRKIDLSGIVWADMKRAHIRGKWKERETVSRGGPGVPSSSVV